MFHHILNFELKDVSSIRFQIRLGLAQKHLQSTLINPVRAQINVKENGLFSILVSNLGYPMVPLMCNVVSSKILSSSVQLYKLFYDVHNIL